MYCTRWLKDEFTTESSPYEDKLSIIANSIKRWLSESGYVENKTGLYLATTNAGVFESITFWKNALLHSPGFANPANFNWTLANGPAGFLARQLTIKGPCYTMIGSHDAIEGCLYHASEDLKTGVITNALISGLDRIEDKIRICIALMIITPAEKAVVTPTLGTYKTDARYASSALEEILSVV